MPPRQSRVVSYACLVDKTNHYRDNPAFESITDAGCRWVRGHFGQERDVFIADLVKLVSAYEVRGFNKDGTEFNYSFMVTM